MAEADAELQPLAELPQCVYADQWVVVLHCNWQDVIDRLPVVDATITDPPYSDETHEGMQVIAADRMSRGPVNFEHWTEADALDAITAWHAVTRGWMCVINDDILGPYIRKLYRKLGRYDFPAIPFVELGKQPRHVGDGPASWSCFIQVARPKTKEFHTWGSLRGAYVRRGNEVRVVKGGKPLWLMVDMVRDYTRPGDLILDPCGGGGITGRAAKNLGRRAIIIERDPDNVQKAIEVVQPPPGFAAKLAQEGERLRAAKQDKWDW